MKIFLMKITIKKIYSYYNKMLISKTVLLSGLVELFKK